MCMEARGGGVLASAYMLASADVKWWVLAQAAWRAAIGVVQGTEPKLKPKPSVLPASPPGCFLLSL